VAAAKNDVKIPAYLKVLVDEKKRFRDVANNYLKTADPGTSGHVVIGRDNNERELENLYRIILDKQ